MKIAIGNDHAGTSFKKDVRKWLEEQLRIVEDFGTNDETPVDYPDCVHRVVEFVLRYLIKNNSHHSPTPMFDLESC